MKKCLVCQKTIERKQKANNTKFCSVSCRNKSYQPRVSLWQQRKQDKIASIFSPNKIKCLICGRFYRQVGTHIVQRHGISARKYREEFELEVKKGILPQDLRELKGRQALENGTVSNLEKGKVFRFKKGGVVPKYKRSVITLEKLKRAREKSYKNRKLLN